MSVQIKRVYDKAEKADGIRVLVDRLWPRGVSKEDAKLDDWLKEVGPSKELREWFGHDPEKFDEFKRKYKEELKNNKVQTEELNKLINRSKEHDEQLTLVFGSKDEKHNQAIVLKELLDHQ